MKRLSSVSLLLLAVASCSGEDPAASEASEQARASVPERYYSAEEPAGAKPVREVHAAAADGERVVLVGAVGGAEEAFVEGAAAFTVVDLSLESCVGDGMGCETPWDYCCVDPAALRSATAMVELREDGRPLSFSPRGFHGLDHSSTVFVEGVAERDEQQNLVVVADRLHVRP